MLSGGLSAEDVPKFLNIHISTVYRYCTFYFTAGLTSLRASLLSGFLTTGYDGYWSNMSGVAISLLRAELKRTIYTDVQSVCTWIKDRFGVPYTPAGVVDVLNRIGFTYKKTRKVTCERNIEKQQIFAEEMLNIFNHQDEKTVIYYADGVHPAHNSRSTYAWIEKEEDLEQPAVSGRDRVNINGLVNAKDVTDVIAVDSERINAQSAKDMYQLALGKKPTAEKVMIISDNAKYDKNTELIEWLKGTIITQIFLPPYSPNLNLIERLGRFLRKKVIDTEFYRTKELFRKALNKFFKNIEKYMSELETLPAFNFRLANSQSISFWV